MHHRLVMLCGVGTTFFSARRGQRGPWLGPSWFGGVGCSRHACSKRPSRLVVVSLGVLRDQVDQEEAHRPCTVSTRGVTCGLNPTTPSPTLDPRNTRDILHFDFEYLSLGLHKADRGQ